MKKKLLFFCLKFDMGEDDEHFYNEVTTFVDEYNALPGNKIISYHVYQEHTDDFVNNKVTIKFTVKPQ